ncbi:MAG: hypothetical protein U0176_04575 [Bacteroidia bacterium]
MRGCLTHRVHPVSKIDLEALVKGEGADDVGASAFRITPWAVLVQPLESVMVTLKVPGLRLLMSCVVAVKPEGPVQL